MKTEEVPSTSIRKNDSREETLALTASLNTRTYHSHRDRSVPTLFLASNPPKH